ncbi:putative RlpA-like domain superfamily protein [Plasmopara halstedii]
MLQQFALLAVTLPALTFATIDDDVTFRGDATALAVAQASAATCSPSIGDNYVAINSDQWDATQNCKQCIEVSCVEDNCKGKNQSVILYVAGDCEGCEDEGLDLSPLTWEFTDCPYEAGTVEPADEKKTAVNILQTDEKGIETQEENTEPTANESGDNEDHTSGTSPFVVVLIVAGAICALALAAVMFKAKKNRIRRDEYVAKSFDTFSSPTQMKKRQQSSRFKVTVSVCLLFDIEQISGSGTTIRLCEYTRWYNDV